MEDDWISSEEERIKKERQKSLARSEKSYSASLIMQSRWTELENVLRNDVQRINTNDEIQKRIGSRIDFSVSSQSEYKLEKLSFPAIYLTVKWSGSEIKIAKQIVNVVNPSKFGQQGGETRSECSKESLVIAVEGDVILLRANNQELIEWHELSRYLLKPMLVPHTTFPRFSY